CSLAVIEGHWQSLSARFIPARSSNRIRSKVDIERAPRERGTASAEIDRHAFHLARAQLACLRIRKVRAFVNGLLPGAVPQAVAAGAERLFAVGVFPARVPVDDPGFIEQLKPK